jgi:hypothetical protein
MLFFIEIYTLSDVDLAISMTIRVIKKQKLHLTFRKNQIIYVVFVNLVRRNPTTY